MKTTKYKRPSAALVLLAASAILTRTAAAECQKNCVAYKTGSSATGTTVVQLPDSAFRIDATVRPPVHAPLAVPPKTAPELRERLITSTGNARIPVLITYRETLALPVLPNFAAHLPFDSLENLVIQDRRNAIIEGIKLARKSEQDRRTKSLRQAGGIVKDAYWLADVLEAELPPSAIAELANNPEIQHVQSADVPPVAAQASMSLARALMNSDWWYDRLNTQPSFPPYRPYNGWAPYRVGVIDTGVRSTHTLLNGSNPWSVQVTRALDCMTNPCLTAAQGGNPDDQYSTNGHGTALASIITGNSSLGTNNRGVARHSIESFKVCDTSTCTQSAILRAFQAAVTTNDIIVTSIVSSESDTGAIAAAADSAFDTGRIIIAAVGNEYQNPVPGSPAIAHKAIAVGDVIVLSNQTAYQAHGPLADGRYKPEVQAPTHVYAASRTSDTAIADFGGTSGAAPFAAAAAVLIQNSYCDTSACSVYGGSTPNAGLVYAGLIRRGNNYTGPFNYKGAGLLKMDGEYGASSMGSVALTQSQVVDIPIYVTTNAHHDLSVGVWWPESAASAHNQIFAYILPPGSSFPIASSTLGSSVFQKLFVAGNMTTGQWTLRLVANSLSVSSQPVYFDTMIRCDVPSYCGS